jgi:O-antigen ligase/tetratricopeptide (TPR) repeat protein
VSRFSIVDLLERTAAVVVVVAVGLSCLLIGGVHATSHALLLGLAVVAAVVDVAARVRRRHPLAVPVTVLPFVVGAALTTLALSPLPHGLRALISPDSVDRLDRLAPLLSPDAAALLRPVLAFDPPEAALALVRLLFALVVVVVVADRARHRDGRARLWRGVLVIAFIVGFAVVFAYATGVARLGDVFGIPVNVNHRARVLGVLGLLCLGRALTLRPRVEAAWFAVGGSLCTLLVPVTASRGGVVALVVGAVALGVVVQRRDAEKTAPRSLRTLLVAAVVPVAVPVLAVVVGALVVAGEDRVWGMAEETLARPDRIKTFLWEPALRVATEHPVTGVGNNGFGVAFPGVLGPGELDATLTYTHAENLVLQTLADHGLVGGFCVLFAVLVVVVAVLRHLKSPAELAAVPALVFVVTGDVFDFVLELPVGIGLTAVALGFVGGRLTGHRPPLVSLRPALAGGALVVLATVGAGAAWVGIGGWRADIDDALRMTPIAARPAALQRALALHPSDATYATQLAIEARRRRQPGEALRFANRALVVWPSFRDAHLEAARALAVGGRLPQAMLEYREAARATLDRALVREITQRTTDVEQRRRALPQPETAPALAALCEVLVGEKRLAEARACFDDVVAKPDVAVAQLRRAFVLAFDAGDLDASRALLVRLVPDGAVPDGEDARLGARLRAAVDGDDAALQASAAWVGAARDPLPLLEWRLATQRALGRLEDATTTVERMLANARSLRQRQSLEMTLVELWVKRGEWARALRQLEQTLARNPRDAAVLAQKALVEVELDRDGDARATLERLRAVAPGDKRILTIEQRLQTSAVR